MDHQARIAYIFAQTVACLCELEAMKAANAARASSGEAPAYREPAFSNLPAQFGIDHNAVVSFLTQ